MNAPRYPGDPSASDIAAMLRAQDHAAREFWVYPGRQWQAEFQAAWLVDKGFPPRVTVGSYVWGEEP
jgi:hypothetical protein